MCPPGLCKSTELIALRLLYLHYVMLLIPVDSVVLCVINISFILPFCGVIIGEIWNFVCIQQNLISCFDIRSLI